MKDKAILIDQLGHILKEKLPGKASQFKMAPGIRLENSHEKYRNAAVLILLYFADEQWKFILIKRTKYPGVHSNQISLPGGLYEESDGDLSDTAIREAEEEIGINQEKVVLLGELTKLEIPVSGIEVSPFVGIYPETPVFHPEAAEVSYLIEVPVSELLAAENKREEQRSILCKIVNVPFFQLGGEKVWGATAMILSEFFDLLKKLEKVDLQ